MITKYPIMTPDGTTVLCEINITVVERAGEQFIAPESHQAIEAVQQVRTAMLHWHNEEIKRMLCPEAGQVSS